MNILIIGNGGREHAFTWKLSQSPLVSNIFVAPGNAGTAFEAKTTNIDIAVSDIEQLAHFAKSHHCDMTLVGPELPLSLGIVDEFRKQGLPCFGPVKAAATLESSKAFAKNFMQRFNIPTAQYATFTEVVPALEYLRQQSLPIVIKADGLAAGKGVVIAHDLKTAQDAINNMLSDNPFGEASHKIIIEEFITGEEASFIVITDGNTILPCATSQDHKTRDNFDRGPNTGGMGAYSPTTLVTPELHERVIAEIIKPTITGMAELGIPYSGFLYAGIMVTPSGTLKVLEFNCRCGDPETQVIMMRLQSDLMPILLATVAGTLAQHSLLWDANVALGVVLAAMSYPEAPNKGAVISGLEPQVAAKNCKIFHSGTTLDQQGKIITNGGRILTITALADTRLAAQQTVYAVAKSIEWQGGVHYRTDIGNRNR